MDWELLSQLNLGLQIHLSEPQRSSCQESSDWLMVRIKSDLEEEHQAGGIFFLAACPPSPAPSPPSPFQTPAEPRWWETASCSPLGIGFLKWDKGVLNKQPYFHPCVYLLTGARRGSLLFSGGLCSAAIKGALLILLPPRCSGNIFNSSLLYASLRRHLIIHFKTRQLFSLCPPSPSDTQRESEF